MRYWPLLLVMPLAVTACDKRHAEATTTVTNADGSVTTTTTTGAKTSASAEAISGLNIDTDKFKANIEIPGLSFGGEHMDIDGIKFYPGTKVRGVRVNATDRDGDGKGEVTMDFTSPAAPSAVSAHMVEQARKAGYAPAGASDAGFEGTKTDDDGDRHRVTVTLAADGAATSGKMTMSGSKTKS